MSDVTRIGAELRAAVGIAATYTREGINVIDAAHAAMRFLNWAPSDEHANLIVTKMAEGAHAERTRIFEELRLSRG